MVGVLNKLDKRDELVYYALIQSPIHSKSRTRKVGPSPTEHKVDKIYLKE